MNVIPLLKKLARDERGGEVLEYALLLALLLLGSLLVLTALGPKVVRKWAIIGDLLY